MSYLQEFAGVGRRVFLRLLLHTIVLSFLSITACNSAAIDSASDGDGDSDGDTDGDGDGDADSSVDGDVVGGSDGDISFLGELVIELMVRRQSEEIVVSSASISIASLQVRSDRGEDFDPKATDMGILDLLDGDSRIVFDDAPPATYSGVILRLEARVGHPSFQLSLGEEEHSLEIQLEGTHEFEVRCDHPAALLPSGQLFCELELDPEELYDRLEERGLPTHDDEPVHIGPNEPSELVSIVEEELPDVWVLRCGVQGGEG